ncbi:MAG TPA: hypothetical protein VF170_08455 [Planctomycetaceae bacterium]
MSYRLSRAAFVRSLAFAVPAAAMLRLRAAEESVALAEPSPLAKDLIGTWVLAGTPEKPVDPPAKGGRLRFFTGRHWVITEADAETGRVRHHHGGTYTLDDDVLTENVEYAGPSSATLIGRSFKHQMKVEGDTLTQIGIDNQWTEVWKRAK